MIDERIRELTDKLKLAEKVISEFEKIMEASAGVIDESDALMLWDFFKENGWLEKYAKFKQLSSRSNRP